MKLAQRQIKSRVGSFYLVASEKGLRGLYWKDPGLASHSSDRSLELILRKAEKQVAEYLEGQRRTFDLPLDLEGTDFQKKVWQELLKIPYAQTKSYRDIAEKIKMPKACRAVGTANGRNPISIIVPCHRVITSNGKLGGYAGGLDVKRKLLALEQPKKKF